MKNTVYYLMLTLTGMLLSGWAGWELQSQNQDLESVIISVDEAGLSEEGWGNFITYTPENGTSTYGTKNMLTGVAVINPGMQIHPPHQHTAEEFLYVVEGEGTWSLNGEESDAKKGDLLYARPWDLHGITNTGDEPLIFFVMKWDNKGIELPVNNSE